MSTPSEQIEAEIWLEASHPHLSDALRRRFFAMVREYHLQQTPAKPTIHFLCALRQDYHEYERIFHEITTAASQPWPAGSRRSPAVPLLEGDTRGRRGEFYRCRSA
ncbi:hypothetical protein BCONGLO52_09260 [Brachybacterium conglomeratum]|uniref:Uncharacterized protein n=2 Tax=Brachybacterium TaxID=43668 RepID=A0A426SJQ3_9MICO|nr:hypothetical protein DS079_09560 [Brachybacterium paraconglomeratum]GLI30085.1 hypothetical protein BCONGLO52_09260 [Brachybacterium conglomeratum]GLK04623.1 hypothetical protein GCM10017597_14230 [Brachybacterium conglomeratum]